MEALVGVGVGGVITIVVAWLTQRHALTIADQQFEHQRQLVAEQHIRDARTLNADLSSRLDQALAWGDSLCFASQQIGFRFSEMRDRDERIQELAKVGEDYFGLKTATALLLSSEVFEDDVLQEGLREHQIKCRELQWLLLAGEGKQFSAVQLSELEKTITSLRQRMDMRRRQLLRTAEPL